VSQNYLNEGASYKRCPSSGNNGYSQDERELLDEDPSTIPFTPSSRINSQDNDENHDDSFHSCSLEYMPEDREFIL
jgi:hypothetical protein